jgi:hypothetical protein
MLNEFQKGNRLFSFEKTVVGLIQYPENSLKYRYDMYIVLGDCTLTLTNHSFYFFRTVHFNLYYYFLCFSYIIGILQKYLSAYKIK